MTKFWISGTCLTAGLHSNISLVIKFCGHMIPWIQDREIRARLVDSEYKDTVRQEHERRKQNQYNWQLISGCGSCWRRRPQWVIRYKAYNVWHPFCGLVSWLCHLGFDAQKTSDKCILLTLNSMFSVYRISAGLLFHNFLPQKMEFNEITYTSGWNQCIGLTSGLITWNYRYTSRENTTRDAPKKIP